MKLLMQNWALAWRAHKAVWFVAIVLVLLFFLGVLWRAFYLDLLHQQLALQQKTQTLISKSAYLGNL